jgi:hypothetical protein
MAEAGVRALCEKTSESDQIFGYVIVETGLPLDVTDLEIFRSPMGLTTPAKSNAGPGGRTRVGFEEALRRTWDWCCAAQ